MLGGGGEMNTAMKIAEEDGKHFNMNSYYIFNDVMLGMFYFLNLFR